MSASPPRSTTTPNPIESPAPDVLRASGPSTHPPESSEALQGPTALSDEVASTAKASNGLGEGRQHAVAQSDPLSQRGDEAVRAERAENVDLHELSTAAPLLSVHTRADVELRFGNVPGPRRAWREATSSSRPAQRLSTSASRTDDWDFDQTEDAEDDDEDEDFERAIAARGRVQHKANNARHSSVPCRVCGRDISRMVFRYGQLSLFILSCAPCSFSLSFPWRDRVRTHSYATVVTRPLRGFFLCVSATHFSSDITS
jgi:hypothetical protein